MDDLTNRQTDVLRALIKEYSETGLAVGSEILEKKYKLGVSPATIRSEMVELARKGYLKKDYFSSGRIPSAKGFRFFIKHLMKEKDISTGDEVAYKNGIWDERDDEQKLLAHATKVLAQRTGLLSIAVTNTGDVYYAGVGNLLTIPEFFNLDVSRALFRKLDELQYWEKILDKAQANQEEVYFMLGEDDFSDPVYETCASILGDIRTERLKGVIGVLGPKRMYYEALTPQVKYFARLIEGIIKDQSEK